MLRSGCTYSIYVGGNFEKVASYCVRFCCDELRCARMHNYDARIARCDGICSCVSLYLSVQYCAIVVLLFVSLGCIIMRRLCASTLSMF